MLIKGWDWEKGWRCVMTFEGHTHYIMNIAVNPKDPNTFSSSCLDRTAKIWNLGSPNADYSLETHEKGVNFVSFYPGRDIPYLATCGDDRTVKIWDYLFQACIQTVEGHNCNVSFAVFRPILPLIVSGSEDGSVKVWNSGTYRCETTLAYALESAWCVSLKEGGNDVADSLLGIMKESSLFRCGFSVCILDVAHECFIARKGRAVLQHGHVREANLTKNTEVLSVNLHSATDTPTSENTPLSLLPPPPRLNRNLPHRPPAPPNGRFVLVIGDGEYIIYTALAWRNKAFGNAASGGSGGGVPFAWGEDSNTYAVLEGRTKVRLFRGFKKRALGGGYQGLRGAGTFAVEGLSGAPVRGARESGFVVFWDWESGSIVRRVEVDAQNDAFYILRFNRQAYDNARDTEAEIGDEGVEEAFEVVAEINEVVKTAKWIEECFVYTTANGRLNYLVGNESFTVKNLDGPKYLLGYILANSKIYLMDKDMNVFAYPLSIHLIEYQTAILHKDVPPQELEAMLEKVPKEMWGRVARFLEGIGLKQEELKIPPDATHKFDLALQLDDLPTAISIASSIPAPESDTDWKLLAIVRSPYGDSTLPESVSPRREISLRL